MIQYIDYKELNKIRKNYDYDEKRKELHKIKSRKPTELEKRKIKKHGKFHYYEFKTDNIFNFILLNIMALGTFIGTINLIKSFSQVPKEFTEMIFYLIFIAFMFFLFISSFWMIIYITIGGKSRKLRKALKTENYEVLDIKPIGFYSIRDPNPENVQYTLETAVQINNQKYFGFEIEGYKKIKNGIIESDCEILLKFEVKTFFGLKTEYSYIVFTYKY